MRVSSKSKSIRTINSFLSSKYLLSLLGLVFVASSIFLWKTQESRILSKIKLQTRLEANHFSSETEKRYDNIFDALERMASREMSLYAADTDKWENDASFYIDTYEGLKSVAWVDGTFKIRRIAPFQENTLFLNETVNQVDWDPLDINLLVPSYDGTELKGYVLGTINIAKIISPVISDIGNDYILQISRNGTIVFSSENWKRPKERFSVNRTITFQDTAVLNISFAPTEELINSEIIHSTQALIISLSFSFITLAAVYFAQKYSVASKLSELRFQKTLESMVEGCQIISPDWRYLFINDTAANQNQRKKEELIGRTVMKCFPGIEKTEYFQLLQRCMYERTPQEMLSSSTFIDGFTNWYKLSIQPAPDGILILSNDVTERKRSDEEIKSLSKFPDENPNPILRFSKGGKILNASKSSAALLNKWGKSVGESAPPDWKKDISNSFTSGEKLKIEAPCEGRTISFILAPIKEMGYVNAYGRDITELKLAQERELKHFQNITFLTKTAMRFVNFPLEEDIYHFISEQLRELVGESVVVVNSVDQTKSIFTTRAISGIGELSKGIIKLIGRNPVGIEYEVSDENIAYHNNDELYEYEEGIYGICHGTIPKAVCCALEKHYRLNKIYVIGFVTNDILFGDAAIFLTHGIELESKETIKLFIEQASMAIQRRKAEEEIRTLKTELEQRVIKRTAQLEAANRELESFSYSVSHDLRAPLRAMSGFSNILVEEYGKQLPKEARRYLDLIEDNSHKMGNLIDDLLLFSRMGKQALKIQKVNCTGIAEQALAELQTERESREIKVVVGKLPACQADPVLIKQVLINLLSNAFKFTKDKKNARVEIGSKNIKDENVYFVKDNGVGFDMRYTDKLFGVFQRLHSSAEFEGTGVGLAIVQRIIQRHGGKVWAEAEVDKGAVFYFTVGENDEN